MRHWAALPTDSLFHALKMKNLYVDTKMGGAGFKAEAVALYARASANDEASSSG